MNYENIVKINKVNKKNCNNVCKIESVTNNGKTVVLSGYTDAVIDIVHLINEISSGRIYIRNLSRIKDNITKIFYKR